MTNADHSPILSLSQSFGLVMKKGKFLSAGLPLLVLAIEILPEEFVHGEHMDLVLLEDGSHGIVTADHAFVVWIL